MFDSVKGIFRGKFGKCRAYVIMGSRKHSLNHSFYLAVIHFIVQFQITFSLAHQWIYMVIAEEDEEMTGWKRRRRRRCSHEDVRTGGDM